MQLAYLFAYILNQYFTSKKNACIRRVIITCVAFLVIASILPKILLGKIFGFVHLVRGIEL